MFRREKREKTAGKREKFNENSKKLAVFLTKPKKYFKKSEIRPQNPGFNHENPTKTEKTCRNSFENSKKPCETHTKRRKTAKNRDKSLELLREGGKTLTNREKKRVFLHKQRTFSENAAENPDFQEKFSAKPPIFREKARKY